jgi:Flp pilus assembly protein TadG
MDIKSERGQTMTEFAVVLPILVVLLFGVIQFGIVFNNYLAITDAARAGARAGAVSREASDPVGACTSAVKNSAGDLNNANLGVSCTSAWTPGADVSVQVQYPYSIKLLDWSVLSGNLVVKTQERVE